MRNSILIIEDSKPLRYILTTIFKADYKVFSSRTYAEAFDYLRSKQIVDLIIINVPNDVSENFMLLSHLSSSSLFHHIPTVVLCESNDIQLRNKTKALGVSLFLTTPFDPIRLSEKVKELMYEKELSRFAKETA